MLFHSVNYNSVVPPYKSHLYWQLTLVLTFWRINEAEAKSIIYWTVLHQLQLFIPLESTYFITTKPQIVAKRGTRNGRTCLYVGSELWPWYIIFKVKLLKKSQTLAHKGLRFVSKYFERFILSFLKHMVFEKYTYKVCLLAEPDTRSTFLRRHVSINPMCHESSKSFFITFSMRHLRFASRV